MSIFVLAVAVLLYFKGNSEADSNGMVAVSFIIGAICSGLAGFIGMKVATKANVRTTNAARTSLGKALEVAFSGGAVMGLGVVGLGVLGLSSLFIIYQGMWADNITMVIALIGTTIADEDNPIELGHIIRSHDACLVCTVHFLNSGKKLRFEV